MPTLARTDVDLLEGLTTAILVDQGRMGADARSTAGTATDASAYLRILFSRLGQPHIVGRTSFTFCAPSVWSSCGLSIPRANNQSSTATILRTTPRVHRWTSCRPR